MPRLQRCSGTNDATLYKLPSGITRFVTADESVNQLWYRKPEVVFEVTSAGAAATLMLRTKRIESRQSRQRETPDQRAGRVFGTHRSG